MIKSLASIALVLCVTTAAHAQSMSLAVPSSSNDTITIMLPDAGTCCIDGKCRSARWKLVCDKSSAATCSFGTCYPCEAAAVCYVTDKDQPQ